jgi:Arc/MetJ-type ribon-helix-helix transcriptional regulator
MSDEMTRARRVKVGATLDPEMVAEVDRYVADHPPLDRSAVIDEALRLWYARRQEDALQRQLTAPRSARERADAKAWKAIRRASAVRRPRERRG